MAERIVIDDDEIWSQAGDNSKPTTERFLKGNEAGSGVAPPLASDHNFQMNRADKNIQYLLRFAGLPYDETETYPKGGRASFNGIMYKSTIDNNKANTPSYSSEFWQDENDDTYIRGMAYPFHGTKEQVPEGWVIYDGSVFDTEANPKNADIFPLGKWPNYSGRVPEGYIDDDNGIVGSEQKGEVISHPHNATSSFAGAAKAPTASFKGKAKAPTASFKGNALPAHKHGVPENSNSHDDGDGVIFDSSSPNDSNNSYNIQTSSVSAGTPSGTVTVNSYTPEGTVTVNSYTPSGSVSTSVAANGGSRNTVDRIVCLWIGRLG